MTKHGSEQFMKWRGVSLVFFCYEHSRLFRPFGRILSLFFFFKLSFPNAKSIWPKKNSLFFFLKQNKKQTRLSCFRSHGNSSHGGKGNSGSGSYNSFDQQQDFNTYGLSPSFLASLNIIGELNNKVFVANVSMIPFSLSLCHSVSLRALLLIQYAVVLFVCWWSGIRIRAL